MFIGPQNYLETYKIIKRGHFQRTQHHRCTHPILLMVASDPDSLCACKILTTLFKTDLIAYKILPVMGWNDLARYNQEMLESLQDEDIIQRDGEERNDTNFVILIGCGGTVDLEEFFNCHQQIKIYVLDNHRPYNLENIWWNKQVKK